MILCRVAKILTLYLAQDANFQNLERRFHELEKIFKSTSENLGRYVVEIDAYKQDLEHIQVSMKEKIWPRSGRKRARAACRPAKLHEVPQLTLDFAGCQYDTRGRYQRITPNSE